MIGGRCDIYVVPRGCGRTASRKDLQSVTPSNSDSCHPSAPLQLPSGPGYTGSRLERGECAPTAADLLGVRQCVTHSAHRMLAPLASGTMCCGWPVSVTQLWCWRRMFAARQSSLRRRVLIHRVLIGGQHEVVTATGVGLGAERHWVGRHQAWL